MTDDRHADVEARLRRTYRAVADATQTTGNVSSHGSALVRSTTRGRPWLGIAAATILLVGVGAALWTRSARDLAVTDAGDLVHVLPGRVPDLRDEFPERRLVLDRVSTSPGRDVLGWSADDDAVVLTTHRDGTGLPPGVVEPIRSTGATGVVVVTDEHTTVWWQPSPDVVVEVRATGPTIPDRIDGFLDGLFLVDGPTWERATRRAGFDSSGEEPLLVGEVDGLVSDVTVWGDIHEGFFIDIGGAGFPVIASACTMTRDFGRPTEEDGRNKLYAVLAPGTTRTVIVSPSDGSPTPVTVEPPIPGVDIAVGAHEFDDGRWNDSTGLDCTEEER